MINVFLFRFTLECMSWILNLLNSMILNCLSSKLVKLVRLCNLCAGFSESRLAHIAGAKSNGLIDVSIGQVFGQMVQRYPQNIFLNSYSQEVSFTYQKAHQLALSLATGLIKELGLKPKDRIGIYSYNKWEWVIIQMAAAMADLILVNINPAYQAEQLAYTLDKVGLKVLFLSDYHKKSNYLEILKRIIPEIQTHDNEWDLTSNKFHFLKAVVRFNEAEQTEKGFINFSQLLVQGDTRYLPKSPGCHQPTNIQFTSGTTGLPKAATLSHYNILNNGYQIGNRLNYTQNDNITLPVPFYHCFGMVMGNLAALTRGAGITIVSEGFDPKKSLQAVSKYKSTNLYGVPTMFIEYLRVLQEGGPNKFDLSSLRGGIVAGSLCSQHLINKIINNLGLKDITNCYGMTQTAPVSFQTSPSDSMVKKTTTVGKILDGLQAKIVDENGQIVKIGQPGQYLTKGWHVMLQYWSDAGATRKSVQNGWMKSGDIGIIDQEGYLSIVGRKKDMIIRGGQNVYPKEIQDFIYKMDGVQDVQVIAVSDPIFGQEIAALIKVKSLQHNKITGRQILNHCKGNIAHYKIPKYVKFLTQFTMTVTGKPQKIVMRQQFEQQIKKGEHKKYVIR